MKAKPTFVKCVHSCTPFCMQQELEKPNLRFIYNEKTLVVKDEPLTQALIISVHNVKKITMQIAQIKKTPKLPSGINHIFLFLKD